MAVLLTNGTYYISLSQSGRVLKVKDINQAKDFVSVGKAAAQKKKAQKNV